jgi:hypothetical protein
LTADTAQTFSFQSLFSFEQQLAVLTLKTVSTTLLQDFFESLLSTIANSDLFSANQTPGNIVPLGLGHLDSNLTNSFGADT